MPLKLPGSLRLLSRESSEALGGLGASVLSFVSHIAALSVRFARLGGGSAISRPVVTVRDLLESKEEDLVIPV